MPSSCVTCSKGFVYDIPDHISLSQTLHLHSCPEYDCNMIILEPLTSISAEVLSVSKHQVAFHLLHIEKALGIIKMKHILPLCITLISDTTQTSRFCDYIGHN